MDWFGLRAKKRSEVIGKVLGAVWMMRDAMPCRASDPNRAPFAGALSGSQQAAHAIAVYLKDIGTKRPEPVLALMSCLLMLYNDRARIYFAGGEFDQALTADEMEWVQLALENINTDPQRVVAAADIAGQTLDKFAWDLALNHLPTNRDMAASMLFRELWRVCVNLNVTLPKFAR